MNITKSMLLLSAASVLAGCTGLSTTGSNIRVTNFHEDIEECSHLGQVTSSSSWGGFAATGVAFENAMNELKNKAGEMGANTVLTQVVSNSMGGTNMVGDAYLCK